MTKNNLKVVKSTKDQELDNKEKNKALEAAINQIRMKIGVMFGSPETTSGGNALKLFLVIFCLFY